MTLLISRTCPRYNPCTSGQFGRTLAAAIAEGAVENGVEVRNVQCLGGPAARVTGVVAVDGPGKAQVRFAGLTVDDVDAVLEAATAHHECSPGAAGEALRQAERRADEAERTREETARRRADEERLHIARELHDSLTHQISVIKVQAKVAVHLADKRGEQVPDALLVIRDAGREAARELRPT